MNVEGRLTVPTAARKKLGLLDKAELQVETTADAIILKPAIVLPREDAWAYSPKHRLLAKAPRDSREGRVRRLTERQLERLAK